jgi:hypothetical protein
MVDELAVPGAVIAEKGADFERAIGEQVGTRNRPALPGDVERADEDLHIERPDLGPDMHTFVAKGDPIPAGLGELQRRPARPAPPRKR